MRGEFDDFLRQYDLESGSRVCWSTLSSCSGCSPVDAFNLPYGTRPERYANACDGVETRGG
ncbi:hypothetical protein GCM10022249_22410 [Enteractinococcus coprophilus]